MNNLNGIGDILTTIHQNLHSMNQVVQYHHTIIEKIKDDVPTTQKQKDIDNIHIEMDKLESRIKNYLDNKISELHIKSQEDNTIENKVSDVLTQAVIKVSQSQNIIPDISKNDEVENPQQLDQHRQNNEIKVSDSVVIKESASNIDKPTTKKRSTKTRKKNILNDLDSEIVNE